MTFNLLFYKWYLSISQGFFMIMIEPLYVKSPNSMPRTLKLNKYSLCLFSSFYCFTLRFFSLLFWDLVQNYLKKKSYGEEEGTWIHEQEGKNTTSTNKLIDSTNVYWALAMTSCHFKPFICINSFNLITILWNKCYHYVCFTLNEAES